MKNYILFCLSLFSLSNLFAMQTDHKRKFVQKGFFGAYKKPKPEIACEPFPFLQLPRELQCKIIEQRIIDTLQFSKKSLYFREEVDVDGLKKEIAALACSCKSLHRLLRDPQQIKAMISIFAHYRYFGHKPFAAKDLHLPGSDNQIIVQWLKSQQFIHNKEESFRLSVQYNDLDRIKELLNENININNQDPHSGMSALMWTETLYRQSHEDALKIAKFLLEHNADPNLQNYAGQTILHFCARVNNTELAKLLIQFKIDINKQDDLGRTALYCACIDGYLEMAKLLLEAGANQDIANKDGKTPFLVINDDNQNYFDLITLLLKHRKPID